MHRHHFLRFIFATLALAGGGSFETAADLPERRGERPGHELLVASFRTGDTEIFIVDIDTGDASNLTRSPRFVL